ncbi:MAG: hypothetical protein JNM59_10365 [Hyphomonadaceae bacterium]|nr:hypothetical protein [Hyphomonadaceae bacterium]
MERRSLLTAMLSALAAPSAFAQTAPNEAPTPASVSIGPTPIEPRNALEHAFVNALNDEAARPAFRRRFLTSTIALALAAPDPRAAPRQIELRPGLRACLIFTSAERAVEVMGAEAPVAMITGRAALTRLRGANAIININLVPALVLEPDDIEAMLAMPDETPTRAPPEPFEPRLAGPTQ